MGYYDKEASNSILLCKSPNIPSSFEFSSLLAYCLVFGGFFAVRRVVVDSDVEVTFVPFSSKVHKCGRYLNFLCAQNTHNVINTTCI